MSIKKLIDNSPHIVFLTGAGVSTDSGIPDFKTQEKNWKYNLPRAEIFSRPYFNQNPKEFWKIYRETFNNHLLKPNRFHYLVSALQNSHKVTVTTQNVDGLHSMAGSENVIEMHGNMNKAICTRLSCQAKYDINEFYDEDLPRCPKCNKVMKPDISLFFEGITGFSDSQWALYEADLLVVAGTSLDVGPANELPFYAKMGKPTKTLWINADNPPYDYDFDYKFIGEISKFVDNLTSI